MNDENKSTSYKLSQLASSLTLLGLGMCCTKAAYAVEVISGDKSSSVNLDASYPLEQTFITDANINSVTVGISSSKTNLDIAVNTGKIIESSGNTGIRLHGWGTQKITNSGSIIGHGSGSGSYNGGIVVHFGAADITNKQGGLIRNDQTDGIFTNNNASVVANHGTIQTGLTGVYYEKGGTFNQSATGIVEDNGAGAWYGVIGNSNFLVGNNEGVIRIRTNKGVGVLYRGNTFGTFTNSGTIFGTTAGVQLYSSGSVNLINTGVIETDSGNLAIDINSSNNTVTLGTGSTLIGDAVVRGGTNNKLILEGSSSEDNNLTDFDTLTMNGIYWDLSGTAAIKGAGNTATTVSSGALEISGTLNNTAGGTTINSGATLIVSGLAKNASGTTIQNGAVLQIGNGGSTGDVTGAINNDGTLIFDRSNQYLFATTITGNGHVNQAGAGETILSSVGNNYTGTTTVSNGVLSAGSTNTFSASSAHEIFSNGTLNLNGYNQTINSLAHAGTLTTGGAPGTVLTISNNYTGNDGTIVLNTVLGDDSSVTDQIIINGNTTGTTKIKINNIGGIGDQTVNGIEVITVSGMSNGNFVKDGRIVAGVYDYELGRGTGVNSNNWYLRSLNRSLRPEAGSYLSIVEHNQGTFNHSFHDRQQLLDNQYQSSWARVEYNHAKSEAGNGLVHNKTDRRLVHFGSDVFQNQALHIGLMGAYSKADVDSMARGTGYTANSKSDGYSLGAYATWFDQQPEQGGFYIDGYAQYNWFDNKINGSSLAQEKFDSYGVTASVEGGYAFPVYQGSLNWTLEPQAQLIYNYYSSDDHVEQGGTRIKVRQGNDFTGRLGVRLNGKGERVNPFVTLNYWTHGNHPSISMNNHHVDSDRARHIGEAKLGLEVDLNKNVQLFGQVQGSVGGNHTRSVGGSVGAAFNW